MRRLASVFSAASRRTDKSDVPSSADDASPSPLVHKKSKVFSSLSRKHLSSIDPLSLPQLVPSNLTNSSSSSSSGSTTLRTPDDDGLPRTPSKKGSWKSWLAGKNAAVSDHSEGRHSPPWQSFQNALHPSQSSSNETDDASTHSEDPYTDDIHTSSHSTEQMTTARANARILIMNSLVQEPTAAPLFRSSGTISFPRSCHISRCLRRRETLESELHKKSLLTRLENLSPSAELSIVPFTSKPILPNPQAQRNFQDDVFPSADSASFHSSGLESWVSRPCFEDRLQMWTRSDSGEIIRTRIPGSHLGVAALELSEPLELLAGTLHGNYRDADADADIEFHLASEFTLPPLALDPDLPAAQKQDLVLEPLSLPPNLSQFKASPVQLSPLHQPNNTPQALPEVTSPTPQLNGTMPPGSTVPNNSVPKRGVRFADDDGKDDQIPLGYVLRIRKNKEQKAQFLREERERRARATQLSIEDHRAITSPQEHRVSGAIAPPRQRLAQPLISLNGPSKSQQSVAVSRVLREEDHLRREAEKIEMEKLRRSRELARKQAEERERSYAEELQATRIRREASRAGRPLDSAIQSARLPDHDHSVSRDSMHVPLRRSSLSRKLTPELVFSPVSLNEGSPSSSVPATPGSQYSLSRPPSLYSAHTTSSEDVRGRESKHAIRRMSVVSDPSKGMLLHPPYDPRVSFNPYGWMNIPPVPPIPAVPMVNGVPFYGMDMPLLPPTAPFMMNQFGARSRSSTGSAWQQSPLQSSTSLPRNYSSEGVDSSSRNSSLHSFGSHQRRPSDDATRMSKTREDPRSGTRPDTRGGRTTSSTRVTSSQSGLQRSDWPPHEQGPTKKPPSLRPVSGVYPSGPPPYVRQRTAAS